MVVAVLGAALVGLLAPAGDPPDDAVRVPARPDVAPAVTGPPLCSWRAGGHGSCGPTLLTDLRLVTGIEPAAQGAVLVAHRGGGVSRLDLRTGEPRWSAVPVAGAADVAVHWADAAAFVTHPRGVVRLDPATGATLWVRQLLDAPAARPLPLWALEETAFVLAPDGTLSALDTEDGSVRWQEVTDGGDALLTGSGLVVVGRDGSTLWHPTDGLRWQVDAGVAPRRGLQGERPDGPLPLAGGGLLEGRTGLSLDIDGHGPTILRTAGPVTLRLNWPIRTPDLAVTAYGPGGATVWSRHGLALPCCLAALVPATDGRVAVTTPRGRAVLLGLEDGIVLADLVPPPRLEAPALVGVVADLALWQHRDGLVGAGFAGEPVPLVLVKGTEILALDPLLLAGPEEVVAATAPRRSAPADQLGLGPTSGRGCR